MARIRNIPKDAFDTAVGFHEAALRCATEDPLPGGGNCCPSAPSIVNAAFAIELYFKAMSLKRGVSIRRHDLAELFREVLQDDERQAIGSRWMEGHFPSTYEHLLGALDHLADTFRRHRYQYEHEHLGVSLGSLFALVRACYLGTRDIVPAWTVHPHLHQRLKLFGLNGVNVPRGTLPSPEPNPKADIAKWL